MRTIGLLGGMSWESSAEYYRLLNQRTRELRGGLHSARCVLYSLDFAEVERMQAEGRWGEAAEVLAEAARALEAAGADLLLLCTNTMHKVADEVAAAVGIPLVHLVDVTAEAVRACNPVLHVRMAKARTGHRPVGGGPCGRSGCSAA